MKLVEPDNVPELFTTGLADFQLMAGLLRLALYSDRHVLTGHVYRPFVEIEPIVRVRLVMPTTCWQTVRRQIDDLIEEHRTMIC